MERIDPSRAKYAWVKGKPWLFGKELPYALAVTVVDIFVSTVVQNRHFTAGLLSYLVTFVVSAIIVFVVVAGHAYMSHPRKVVAQELGDHLKDHPNSVVVAPSVSTLEIFSKTRGIVAHLLDEASERVQGTPPGFIYMRADFYVSAGHDNPHPLTILGARGTIWLDDDTPLEIDGELVFWFDEMVKSNKRGEGLPIIPPGHTASLMFKFTVPAKPAKSDDPEGWNFHRPTSASIQLRVFDSQHVPYPFRGAIEFEVADLLESL